MCPGWALVSITVEASSGDVELLVDVDEHAVDRLEVLQRHVAGVDVDAGLVLDPLGDADDAERVDGAGEEQVGVEGEVDAGGADLVLDEAEEAVGEIGQVVVPSGGWRAVRVARMDRRSSLPLPVIGRASSSMRAAGTA